MEHISDWLESIGLGKHIAVFAKNEIDFDILGEISEVDLEAFGFSYGDRKRLLRAVRERDSAATAPGTNEVNELPASQADRRQLTVMFCDLVGSTELSVDLELEAYRDLLRTYQDAVAGVITRYEGHIARYMGDGILAYFGFPQAHENAVERAAHAALGILPAVAKIRAAGRRVDVRIGVATGLVVVGDIIGAGASQEEAVLGETPNLAARLHALSEPGQILFSQTSRDLTAGLFDFIEHSDLQIKGFERPVSAFRLTGVLEGVSRFLAGHRLDQPRYVGREDELATMQRRFERAGGGHGQAVMLCGEPGIGKSRLMAHFLDEVADRTTVLRYQCSPFRSENAYYPFAQQVSFAATLQDGDEPHVSLAKLRNLLAQSTSPDKDVTALSSMLSLRLPDGVVSAPTNDVHTAIFDALFGLLCRLAEHRRVVVIFEDLHWIDQPSLELLHQTIQRISSVPVLAVMTFRPEFTAPWAEEPHAVMLSLGRLDETQAGALATSLAQDAVSDELLTEIVARSDGIPLFVEELTRNVLDAVRSGVPFDPASIPSTLQDSLAARLDRLGTAREVAQVGAVVGREFSARVLSAMALFSEERLKVGLSALENSGLIFRRTNSNDVHYTFKHALVQDAAYDSLLRDHRRRLHQRVAETIEQRFADSAAGSPAALARHFEAAGETAKAAQYYFAAGSLAQTFGVGQDSPIHYEHAVSLIANSAMPAALAELELDCQSGLCASLVFAEGPMSERAHSANLRALELCRDIDDPRRRFVANWGRWFLNHFGARNLDAAVEDANRLLVIGERQVDKGLVLQAHHSAWTSHWSKEDLTRTLRHATHGMDLYDANEHGHHFTEFGGHDPGMCCHMIAGLVSCMMGKLDTALRLATESIDISLQVNHGISEIYGRSFATTVMMMRREPDQGLVALDQLEATEARLEGLAGFFILVPRIIRGWYLAQQGDVKNGVEIMLREFETMKQSGFPKVGFPKLVVAEGLHLAGSHDEALRLLDEAEENGKQVNEQIWMAEIARSRGNILATRGLASHAATQFDSALTIARRQGATLFELRAARDFARMRASEGRTEDAHNLLQPVYARITEGHHLPDLLECRELLRTLR